LFQWEKAGGRVWGRVPLTGGEVTEQPFSKPNQMAISPDGKQIAHAFYDEQNRRYKVRVRPLETDEPSMVFNISPLNFLLWTTDGKGLLYREIESSAESDSTVWLKMISGGEPKQFLSVKPDNVFNISQSSDGKKTAVVRGRHVPDAVMLTKIEPNSEGR
jgi:protease II